MLGKVGASLTFSITYLPNQDLAHHTATTRPVKAHTKQRHLFGNRYISPRIWDRWFALPDLLWLMPLPITGALALLALDRLLTTLPRRDDGWHWVPFVLTTVVFLVAFLGLAYSFYPYIVPDRLTITAAASAPESLLIVLIGTMVVLPIIIAYSILAYTLFRGKATTLSYD